LTLHGRSTALNCAITTVQYQPYQYRRIFLRSRGRNGAMWLAVYS